MAWRYNIRTGKLFLNSQLVGGGYAGKGPGKNNASMTDVPRVGPLPVGTYIIGAPYDSAKVGKYALPLAPDKSNVMFGRSAFRIHGDSIQHPGEASEGCIVVPRNVRERIVASGDHTLVVYS